MATITRPGRSGLRRLRFPRWWTPSWYAGWAGRRAREPRPAQGYRVPTDPASSGTPGPRNVRRGRPAVRRALLPRSTSPARAARRSAPGAAARLDHQLHQAGLLPGRVLDADVLDVDPGPARVGEDPGQLARLVADEDGHDLVRRAGPRRACRGPGPGPRCRGAGRPRCRSAPSRRLSSSADWRARSAWTVSSRSAATPGEHVGDRARGWRRGCRSTSAGSEAAIRVTSRMPWPQRRTAVSSACSRRAATIAGDQLRGVGDEGDGPVVGVGVHDDRDGAAERDQFQGEVEHLGVGVPGRRQHPGAALEEVGGGGERARASPARHRVRADVRRAGRGRGPPARGAGRP